MTTRFSYVAPPAVLLATLAAAPASDTSGGPGTRFDIHCSAVEALSGSIGRTISLHADHDGRRDAAAIVGDDVVVVTGPDPYQYSRAVGLSGVSAIARMAGSGGGSDRIVVAHGQGLSAVSRNPAVPVDFVPVLQSIGGSAWAGARSVVSMDVDGNGTLDVVGLDSTGATLLCVTQSLAGTFSAQPNVALGAELSHLVEAPWGVAATTLGAVLHTPTLPNDSVVVIDVDGNLVSSYSPGGAVDDLVHVHGQGGAVGLAILANDELTVVRPGAVTEASVDLSALAPSALGTADVDGDGRTDLLLNSTTVGETTVLYHQTVAGKSYRMDLSSAYMTVDLELDGADMSGQLANAVGADFDRDGDVDLFQMVECIRGAVLRRGTPADEEALHPDVVATYWNVASTGSTGIFDVVLPALPNGGLPDVLEVAVYTNDVGAPLGAPQSVRVVVQEDVAGYNAGDLVPVFVSFPGELGEESSVTVRCFEMDAAGLEVVDCGAEDAVQYAYDEATRGTNNGPAPKPGKKQSGKGKMPPRSSLAVQP